ncbi:hypothetical protein MNV49_006258 [Pseudohyphozyma bogoriensis]|nr:hypothetical protein MNV49_006258 [Pseudohyphozyma bogoriensis]
MSVHYRRLSNQVTPPTHPREFSSRSSVSAVSGLAARAHSKQFGSDELGRFAFSKGLRIPRSRRQFLIKQYAGWAVAAALLLLNLLSRTSLLPTFASTSAPPPLSSASAKGTESRIAKGGIQSNVTIISSFYKVESGKKHSVVEYEQWMRNFLSNVELPIIFYCAPSMRAQISKLRGNKPITIISNYEAPWDMPPLQGLGGYEWALTQHKLDPEAFIHVPDVYGVWTAKPWIVQQAKNLNPYLSEYFFWVDAGAMRDYTAKHNFAGLASALDKIYHTVPDDTLMLSAVMRPMDEGLTAVRAVKRFGRMDAVDRLQGGWYGGKGPGIDWWAEETLKITTQQAALGRFAAKEQPVWNHAASLNWQKIYVQNMHLREGDCGPDEWFTFEWFADGTDCRIPVWNGPEYARILSTTESAEGRPKPRV